MTDLLRAVPKFAATDIADCLKFNKLVATNVLMLTFFTRLLLAFLSVAPVLVAAGQRIPEPTIHGRIIDQKSGAPIPFATIRLKTQQGVSGLFSNTDGDFQIPLKYKSFIDSITISCIGYTSRRLVIGDLNESVNVIRLRETARELAEVTIESKNAGHLTAFKIVKAAVDAIPYNFPKAPNSYLGYYRDYQIEESQYVNLNEAIVEIFDQGFGANDQLTTNIMLYDYRRNEEFRRDSATELAYDNTRGNKFIPGATISPFGGNELTLLRLHDPLRNSSIFSYSFVDEFDKDFVKNHQFKLVETLFLNTTPLYHISFHTHKTATDDAHYAEGDIYIEKDNYAIHKLEYSTFEIVRSKPGLLYTIQLEYSGTAGKMHLNYISFNNLFKLRNPNDFLVNDVLLDQDIEAIVITFNHVPEKKSAMTRTNYTVHVDGRWIEVIGVSTNAKHPREVRLRVAQSVLRSVNKGNQLKVQEKNITDLAGREINKITYLPVNQFRELFVQKATDPAAVTDRTFIQKDRPLFQHPIGTRPADTGSYWMNSPLRKQ